MIDAVFLTWNARDQALDCVGHLRDASVLSSITVVDNASGDGTAEAVRSAHPDVNVIAAPSPLGLAAALNRGAALGSAPFVLYLNDDVFARAGSVATLLAALRERPDAVAAGGQLVGEDRVVQVPYQPQRFPRAATLVARLIGVERLRARLPRARRSGPSDEGIVVVEQLAGACLLVRRSAVERVGGWDERYWFWYEDVDFARRLSALGSSLYVPAARFRHVGGATARRLTRPEGHRRMTHGMLRYASTHCSPGGRVTVALVIAATSLARAARRLRGDRAGARLYGATARDALQVLLRRPDPEPEPTPR